MSPAQAFLASYAAKTDMQADESAKPDDKGQTFGLENEYIIGRVISHGGFGVVKEVQNTQAHNIGTAKAVKIVRKIVPGAKDVDNDKIQLEVEHEVSVWRHLKHRHILSLHAVYETDFATFCVMDLNIGGTLFDAVRRSRSAADVNDGRKGLPPHLSQSYAFQLACALRYLHEDIRVCHRDVKLENCLIDMTGPDVETTGGLLRLCDFGLADFLYSSQSMTSSMTLSNTMSTIVESQISGEPFSERLSLTTRLPVLTTTPTISSSVIIGTLEYASPRGLVAHRKLYETAGDIWAFGVVVYALCVGELPFRHPIPSKVAGLILRAEWDDSALRQAAPDGDEVAIDLVHGCLEKDIDLRLTIRDILGSPWFDGFEEGGGDEENEVRMAGWGN
jgi:serine/threonine protein kinase